MCISCRFFKPNAHANPKKPHHCDFVNAAFGDASLRLECDDHEAATAEQMARAWEGFVRAP
jgi:hypothetical protein